MLSNDAKSCYDRIVHAAASLSMQRVGMPTEPIIMMFSTIQELTHTVRSVHGDSTRSYSGKLWGVPIHGTGQGNGASPSIWAVVSTPILNMLRKEGYGAIFELPITHEQCWVVGFAFVASGSD